jgi:hypothetical protein
MMLGAGSSHWDKLIIRQHLPIVAQFLLKRDHFDGCNGSFNTFISQIIRRFWREIVQWYCQ